ncbi:MAG: sulfatase-like hydrolase/transferase, partial [Myxococcota bacterium]
PRRADWGNPNPESETERIVDGYDLGIQLADAGLQGILDALEDYGWWSDGALLVVTSDHGELLGEVDGAFGHSGARLHAGLTDVPLLVRHEGAAPPELWDGMPALAVYDLLQGRTPARESAVAVAFTAGTLDLEAAEPGVAAIWSEDDAQRVQWTTAGVSVGTRTAEGWSDEAVGEEPPALLQTLQPLLDRLSQAYTDPEGLDADTEEALRALGYLE